MKRKLTLVLLSLAAGVIHSIAASITTVDYNPIGIPYGLKVELDENSSVVAPPDHVGAWSWDEDGFPATAKGWTHTSKWVQLELAKPALFTLTLESAAGVSWPSAEDATRVAGTNLFPSFTLYRGWDTDAGVTTNADGTTLDQDHTFNNRGNIAWAEDVTFIDYLDNATSHSSTRQWVLPAGRYTIDLGGNSPATIAEGRQGYKATFTTTPAPGAISNAALTVVDYNPIGIPYGLKVELDENSSVVAPPDHVGAWSWDEDGFPATAKGWTHTSKWVQLELAKPARFTLTLESASGVAWPSAEDPSRLAGANLFPSFTLYRGWDTDAGVTTNADGTTLDQDHTFNNRGNIAWAEDVSFIDYLDNASTHSSTRQWVLPAGRYTVNLGGNSPATIAEGRQGYKASFTTTPLVVSAGTKANGVAYLTYDRAAWATLAPSADYLDIHGNPTGLSGPSADSAGKRWMFPDRLEGTNWVAAAYPKDFLTPLPDAPLVQPARGFALPVNTYGVNSFAAKHAITTFDSSTDPEGYIGLGGSLRATSDFNEPGASVWWEHLALRKDPADSIWKLYATSGPGKGSVFELVNVTAETVNGHLQLSGDYVFGNTDWLQFFQDVNGHVDTNAILGHIELVPAEVATLLSGQATINFDEAAWGKLASAYGSAPVLTLSAFFNQAEANALDQDQLLATAQTGASYTGQAYAMNGASVANLPGRFTQPTTFAYTRGDFGSHTGKIGLGGVARFAVLGGLGGNLLYGDYTLEYDAKRVALGGSGWYLFANIPPVAPAFDLLNVTVMETPTTLTIAGDLAVTFEIANLLYSTPSDALKDVGDFSFTGYTVPLTTPSISSVSKSGGNLVVQGVNGLPGTPYVLVSAASLSVPAASWTSAATGTFDGLGAAVISLPINQAEPARFFRLIQP